MGQQDDGNIETPDLDNSISNENGTPNKDNSQNADIDYKQRYSDSTKEAQRLVGENKQLGQEQLINNAFRQVLKDNSALLDMDEEIAKEVVKAMHEDGYADTDSYEDLMESLREDEDETPKPIDEKKLTEKIRKQIKSEEQTEKSQKVLDDKLSKYDEETKKKYLEEFTEILGDKKLTPKQTEREIDKIIMFYSRNKDDEALGNLASGSMKPTKTSTKNSMTIEKLKGMGVPESDMKSMYPHLFPKK